MFTMKKEMTYVRDAVSFHPRCYISLFNSLFAKLQLRYTMFWLMFLTILKNKTGYLCQNRFLIVYGWFKRDFLFAFSGLLVTFACFLNVQSFLWIPSNLHSVNFTPKPYGEKKESYNPKDISKITDTSVQGSAWKKQTENVDECVSQETKKDLETPCGDKVSPRPRRLDPNNMCHIKMTAHSLFQTIVSVMYLIALFSLINCFCRIQTVNKH